MKWSRRALIGNLATDVDLKEVGDGKKVATFLLAVDRPGKAPGPTSSAWRPGTGRPSRARSILSKGARSRVDGRLRSRWQTPGGEKRTAVEVVASRVEFVAAGTACSASRRGRRAVRGRSPFAATT